MICLIAVSVNLAGMLLIYSFMAFTLARLKWRRRGVIAVLATIIAAEIFWIVPAMIGFGSSLVASSASYSLCFGNWLVSAFGVVIFCQTVTRIPRELVDSARLDGCSWLGTYWHVLLPFVRRDLGLIALLTVMATALPFCVALIAPGSDPLWPLFERLLAWRPIPQYGIGAALGLILASLVMTAPVIVIFLLARRYLEGPSLRLGVNSPSS
jgi:ABC-type glycerol-3-phosphate transport system permease component